MQTHYIKPVQTVDESVSSQLISKYFPYWPLFLLMICIGITMGYLIIHYTTPLYEATATLIIKDEKKGNEESKMMESLDQISSKQIVENEIEVIQSRKVMNDVANKLGLYSTIYEQGKVNKISAYLTSPISIKTTSPDSLIKINNIKLNYDEIKKEVRLNDMYRYPLNKIVNTPFGSLEFIPNKNYEKPGKPINQLYFSLINTKELVPELLKNLKVETSSKLSSIVKLSYTDEVPKKAEDVLNQLINSYRQSEINEKDELAKNTLAFVEERLQLLTVDLDSIERKIQRYRSGKNAVDISSQGQLYLQNVSSNDQKLSEVNSQISVLDQVEKFVLNDKNSEAIVPSTLGITDPMLSQLMDKLYASQLEFDKLKNTVGKNNPALTEIQNQINKIKPNIIQNIQSHKNSLLAAKENLNSTNNNYNSLLVAVPKKERQLLDISREQQIKSNIYSFLLQKKEESEISFASNVSNNKVVDNALANLVPVKPNKIVIYLVSIIVLTCLFIAFIKIKESIRGRILYRNEIESRTSIPIIGEIAFNKSKSRLVITEGERSFIAEEFRKLRISLSFLKVDNFHKKILITSSISGEGKSFIAANLGVSFAINGKKVVLVDMDLNNPTLQKLLNINSDLGVTQFLRNESQLEDIIKKAPLHENLFFIPTGKLPKNPTELLSNGKVIELIQYLDKEFDVVIIDTSPMVLVTDAYILSSLCDATLYIIRHNYTPKMLVKRIDSNLQINPIKNPAILFNGIKNRGFFKNNYGYGNDYIYGDYKKLNKID